MIGASHLTHRCHDRRFLLKFARDRDAYRKWLRVAVHRYGVPVYGFCITGNHVHLIVHVQNKKNVGLMMHLAAGAFARQLNRRKGHEGSVWEHPYRCTIVQDGRHLLNCLRYVSLNMVRAGVVQHPSEWRWCGHDELMGTRTRYRIIDIQRLLVSLDIDGVEDFRRLYGNGIEEALNQGQLAREAMWSEAVAVGNREFVHEMAASCSNRSAFNYEETGDQDTWSVREDGASYSPVSGAESASKAP
jgi:putative transposase